MRMNRVLVITYYWPPAGGSGVQRWLKFAKYLPQYGWEPVIYTPLNPEANSTDSSLAKDIAPSLEVVKRNITEPYAIYKFLSGKKKNEKIAANIIGEQKSGGLSMFIRGNLFIPDPRCWWIRPSIRFLKKYLKEHPVDAIVSTGPPHSMHLIARGLHKALNIPWIADFRDPWTKMFYFKHLNLTKCSVRKHERLEHSVIDEADCVVVVSPQMQEDFSAMTQTPVSLITNGFDPDDFSGNNSSQEFLFKNSNYTDEAAQHFTIVHTGLLPEAANPDLFWEVLGEKCAEDAMFKRALLIVVMGQTDTAVGKEIGNAALSDNFKDLGYAPHSEAVAWQKKADILLLPLRKEKEAKAILTGKFFEYLASGSQIMAFGPTDSNLGDAIRETESGTICEYTDKQGIRAALDAAYKKACDERDAARKGTAKKKSISPAAMKYSRSALAERYSQLLDTLHSR